VSQTGGEKGTQREAPRDGAGRASWYEMLRKIAFLWVGPGSCLTALDMFAPRLGRYGWLGLLLAVGFAIIHNSLALVLLYPSIRRRISRSIIVQWITVGAGAGAWIAIGEFCGIGHR
jgi:predicted outer membrane lipoprotein